MTWPAILVYLSNKQDIARRCGQSQRVIEFPVGKQTGVGGDPGAVELQLQAPVEISRRGRRSESPFGFRIRTALQLP